MAYWRHSTTKQVRKSDKKPDGDKWVRIKAGANPVADRPRDPVTTTVTAPVDPDPAA